MNGGVKNFGSAQIAVLSMCSENMAKKSPKVFNVPKFACKYVKKNSTEILKIAYFE